MWWALLEVLGVSSEKIDSLFISERVHYQWRVTINSITAKKFYDILASVIDKESRVGRPEKLRHLPFLAPSFVFFSLWMDRYIDR